MKLPESLFKIINFVVRGLLNSPIHGYFSDSLMVIGFNGRKTGRSFRIPVRYLVAGDVIQCFTSRSGKWWRSVAAANDVTLLLRGKTACFAPEVTTDDTQKIGSALEKCLELYPQDALYHGIVIGPDGKPDQADFEAALPEVVLIEFRKKAQ